MFSISICACTPPTTTVAPQLDATVAIEEPTKPPPPPAPPEPTGPIPLVMRTDPRLMTHGDEAIAVGLAGKRVVSAARGSIRIWDRASGVETLAIPQAESVRGLVVYPDGERMAVANEQRVRVLDLGGQVERSTELTSTIKALALSHDGKRLAVAHYSGLVLLDAQTLARTATLPGSDDPGDELAFVGDDLVAFARRGPVKLWRPGQPLRELIGPQNHLRAVAATADGALIAACADDKLFVWKADGTPLWQADAQYCSAIAFSPDAKELATELGYGDITLWDPQSGTPYQGLYGHESGVSALSFTGDGALLSASSDHTVREWDLVTATERRPRRGHVRKVTGVALFAKQKQLLSTGGKQLFRWSVDDPSKPRALPSTGYFSGGCVAVSPDGTRAARATDTVDLVDLRTGKHLRQLSDSYLSCKGMAFSPDGQRLAVLDDQDLTVFDLENPAATPQTWKNDAYLGGIAYAPDGAALAVGVHDKGVLLLDAKTLAEVGWLTGGESHTSVAFSPDGTRVAAGDLRHVWLWDRSAPKKPLEIAYPPGWVRAVRFVPQTRLLAYGGDAGRVHFWRLDAHAELLSFEAHRHGLTSLDVSGWRLATGGTDLTAAVWALDALDPKAPGSLHPPLD